MPSINPVHWTTLVCIFEKIGYVHVRTKGDHMVFSRPGSPRPIIIPKYEEVPVFIIRNNMRTAGLSREEYFRLLAECS